MHFIHKLVQYWRLGVDPILTPDFSSENHTLPSLHCTFLRMALCSCLVGPGQNVWAGGDGSEILTPGRLGTHWLESDHG